MKKNKLDKNKSNCLPKQRQVMDDDGPLLCWMERSVVRPCCVCWKASICVASRRILMSCLPGLVARRSAVLCGAAICFVLLWIILLCSQKKKKKSFHELLCVLRGVLGCCAALRSCFDLWWNKSLCCQCLSFRVLLCVGMKVFCGFQVVFNCSNSCVSELYVFLIHILSMFFFFLFLSCFSSLLHQLLAYMPSFTALYLIPPFRPPWLLLSLPVSLDTR